MSDKETRPFEKTRQTARFSEGDVTPEATTLNWFIDRYIAKQKALGREIAIPPSTDDVNNILAEYCDDHERRLKEGLESEELSDSEKRRLHLAFETLLDVRLRR